MGAHACNRKMHAGFSRPAAIAVSKRQKVDTHRENTHADTQREAAHNSRLLDLVGGLDTPPYRVCSAT